MDPNETLRRIREHAATLDSTDMSAEDARQYLAELAELFVALDEWLSKGGFPPDAWQR